MAAKKERRHHNAHEVSHKKSEVDEQHPEVAKVDPFLRHAAMFTTPMYFFGNGPIHRTDCPGYQVRIISINRKLQRDRPRPVEAGFSLGLTTQHPVAVCSRGGPLVRTLASQLRLGPKSGFRKVTTVGERTKKNVAKALRK